MRSGDPALQVGQLSTNQRLEIREERRHHFKVSVPKVELKHPRYQGLRLADRDRSGHIFVMHRGQEVLMKVSQRNDIADANWRASDCHQRVNRSCASAMHLVMPLPGMALSPHRP